MNKRKLLSGSAASKSCNGGKGLFLLIASLMIVALTACGAQKTIIDYGDAESFEAALNSGANLEGKVVQFVARDFHPGTEFGYNVVAGEHLNFVSEQNSDIKVGDTAVVRATKIDVYKNNVSWIIHYEKVDNAEIGNTTITSAKAAGTNGTSAGSTSNDTSGKSSGSESKTSGLLATSSADDPLSKKKPIELKDYGWTINDDRGTAYVNYVGMVYNPNDELVALDPKVTVTVKNGDGSIMATNEKMGSVVMPGDTVTLCGYFSMPSSDLTEDAQIMFDVNCGYGTDSSYHSPAKSTDLVFTNVSEIKGKECYITGELTNNFSETIRVADTVLILRKNGEIVYITRDSLSGLEPGKAKAFEFPRVSVYPDYDTIEISAMPW